MNSSFDGSQKIWFFSLLLLLFLAQELESMADPMRKEVSVVRKKIDSVNKELKPLGSTVQKKVNTH